MPASCAAITATTACRTTSGAECIPSGGPAHLVPLPPATKPEGPAPDLGPLQGAARTLPSAATSDHSPWADERHDAGYPREEPGAGKPHARICEGESRMAELLDRDPRLRRPFLALLFPDASARALDLGDDRGFRLHSAGWSVDNPLAACFACWSRMAMWNQSRIGGFVIPALAKIDRRPGQRSVNAVSLVPAVRPTVSRLRGISTAMSVSILATAPKSCRPPSGL